MGWVVHPHLSRLEDEAISILREACAERERPALMFSGGKDSIVLLRLAEKAFRPARFPFPLLHVDTGQNYDEVIAFRDARVAELGERLIVARVQDSIDRGTVREDTGPSNADVRAWCIANRVPVNAKGAVRADARAAYDAALQGA